MAKTARPQAGSAAAAQNRGGNGAKPAAAEGDAAAGGNAAQDAKVRVPAGGGAVKGGAAQAGAAKGGTPKGSAPKGSAPKGGSAKGGSAKGSAAGRSGSGNSAGRPAPANGARSQGRGRRGVVPPAPAAEPEGPAAWLRWATFGLAILGLAASAYLTYTHFTDSALAGCTETSGAVNCGKVTTSPQSIVFGIPVAVLGLAFYVFLVAIMSPFAWRSQRREIALVRMLSLVVGIGFVLYLLYAELFQIGAICLYCTSVHIITFLLFVLTGLAVAIWGLPPRTAKP
ncbi:MAG: vitamin K epoxide reductase family protein [Streptosporangiaceae bacterium]